MLKRLAWVALATVMTVAGCKTIDGIATDKAIESQYQVIKSPNDNRQYAVITLKNGLTAVLVSDPSAEKSAASLSVGVGLLMDPMTQQGMAHYLEHMLFLGTERFPDTNGYNEFMAKHGGSSNAYTWLDITNYMFQINNDAYPEALDRFSDFFKAPKLYPEYSEKEKNAVNAEWSMRREMDFFGQFKLSRSMFGDHPANRFLIGNLETLSDKPGAKLHPKTVEFYNRYYSANIMKVAMLSNRPLAEMKKLAEQYFGDIKNKNIEKPKVTKKLDFSKFAGKRIHYRPNEDVKKLVIDFTIENNSDQYEVKPNQYVAYLLGSEMPYTPAYELKKRGLIHSLNVNVSPDMYGNYGSFSIDIDLTEKGMQARPMITAAVMQYIDLIRVHGVDEKYFKEIKTSLHNKFRFLEKGSAFDYVSNLAARLQQYPPKDIIAAPYIYRKFDAKAIRKVLDQLTPKRLRIWYISKQEEVDKKLHFYDGEYRIADIANSEYKLWHKSLGLPLALPSVNSLLPESFTLKTKDMKDFDKPEVVVEQPGLKLWFMPSNLYREQPKGVMRIYLNHDANMQSAKGAVLQSIFADIYNLKTSALQTEADIAGMNLRLSPANGIELNISGFTDKQPQLLERALSALKIDISQTDFTQAVDRYVRNIDNSEKQFPFRQLFGFMSALVNADGYEHEVLVKTARSVKLDDLNTFIDELFKRNNIRIFAFGNYSLQDLNVMTAMLKKSLPADRQVVPFITNKVWKPQKNQALVLQKDLPVADVGMLDIAIHWQPSIEQIAKGRVLSRHMRTHAFDKLRTEEQLAYAVGAFATQLKDYSALGLYIQTPVKDVASMQQRFDAYKKEYWQALQEMSEDDFAKIKQSTLKQLLEKPKNLREEIQPLIRDWYDEKWSFDSRQKLIEAVKQVTLDSLKAYYQSTMLNESAPRISIQLRGEKFRKQPFANIKNGIPVESLSELHSKMRYQ